MSCERPPPGWWCSRASNHEGPCAARPIEENARHEENFTAFTAAVFAAGAIFGVCVFVLGLEASELLFRAHLFSFR